MKLRKIKADFYLQNSVSAAKALLGKYLVRRQGAYVMAAKIVETEAYRGKNDPGSHAFAKRTPRNEVMFGPPGRAYVYFCYGNHYLFNIVTEPEGTAGAVLIRAVEPLRGIKRMKKNRGAEGINITNGPAKFTQAMAIGRAQNRADLTKNEIYVCEGQKEKFGIVSKSRIGIKTGLDLKWRFYIKGNSYVSKP